MRVGRPKKPTSLKVLEGNPGHRALPPNEPPSDPLTNLTPPDDLNTGARAIWTQYAADLKKRGLLNFENVDAFKMLCECFAQYRDYRKQLDDLASPYVETPNGFVQPHPLVKMVRDAALLSHRLGSAFGMTPSSRADVSVSAAAEEDEFTELLKRRKQRA